MHQVITFLGKNPIQTRYSWQEKEYQGEVFAQALCQFVEFDRMLVFTTPEAAETTWPVLEALGDERIVRVPIDTGKNDDQLWGMFDVVIGLINEGDTVTFDITHGLRSIPFLAFLFAAYLKSAKQVKIDAIYYGALELGDKNKGVPAPVIDLSKFVSMLDWINATEQFVHTGDSRRLANLLEKPGKQDAVSRNAARTLTRISQGAFLCQPMSLGKEVKNLEKSLKQAEAVFSITSRPFSVLSEQIIRSYGGLTVAGPEDALEHLQTELRLIDWYYDHGQLIQAVTLAREWLVDGVTYRLGEPMNYNKTEREPMERAISGLARVGRPYSDEKTGEPTLYTVDDLNPYGRKIYDEWSERDELKQLWDRLSNVRNTLSHAQHQKNTLPLKKTLKTTREVHQKINSLAQRWGIISEDTPPPKRKPYDPA